MKNSLLLFLVFFTVVTHSFARAATPLTPQNTEKIAQVKAGTLKTAYAGWWGFDRADATECLQSAIDSGVPRLIVNNVGSDWIVNKPLNLISGQHIVFEDGVVVQAKKDAFRGRNDSLFQGANLTNIVLEGRGKAVLRMRKEDYQDASKYSPAEWRSGISLIDCSNVTIRNLTITKTGGDGLYLGASRNGACKNVLVDRVIFSDNHRQGVSVISVEGLTIRNSQFLNTSGTDPQAGIDFEPNHPEQKLVNCVVDNSIFANNKGSGVHIYTTSLTGESAPISITVNRSVISGNAEGFTATITHRTANPPRGRVTFNQCRFERNNIRLTNPIAGSVQYSFKDCVLDFRSRNDGKDVAVSPVTLTTDTRTRNPHLGGIVFERMTVLSDREELPIDFRLREASYGSQATLSDLFSGEVRFKSHGKTRKISLPELIRQKRLEAVKAGPRHRLQSAFKQVQTQDLTRSWRFFPGAMEGQDVISPAFDDSGWDTIDAGNWWQRQGYPRYRGVGWYRKTVTVPELLPLQKSFLFFDGVDGLTEVYVNGEKAGEHLLGENWTGWDLPFHFDVSPALRTGKNNIVVKVTGKSPNTASGINQPVYLVSGVPQ